MPFETEVFGSAPGWQGCVLDLTDRVWDIILLGKGDNLTFTRI